MSLLSVKAFNNTCMSYPAMEKSVHQREPVIKPRPIPEASLGVLFGCARRALFPGGDVFCLC